MNGNFLGIGGGEFVVILIIAILIVGPEKMVELATKLGLMVAKIRRMSNEATKDFREALAIDEMKQVLNEVTSEVKDIGQEVRGVASDVSGIKSEAFAAGQDLQTVAEGKTVAPVAKMPAAVRAKLPTSKVPAAGQPGANAEIAAIAAEGMPAEAGQAVSSPATVAPRAPGKIPQVILDRLGPPTRPNPGEESLPQVAPEAVADDETAAPVELDDTTVIEKEEDWEPVELDELQVHETESEPEPVDEESSS